tara:strand:+ start:751 stop:1014 length:264 start_codon:yes stop_codon:yes gene_type:complete
MSEDLKPRKPTYIEHLIDVIRKCEKDSSVGIGPSVPEAILKAVGNAEMYCDTAQETGPANLSMVIQAKVERHLSQRLLTAKLEEEAL